MRKVLRFVLGNWFARAYLLLIAVVTSSRVTGPALSRRSPRRLYPNDTE
jgi:hypothetical protein